MHGQHRPTGDDTDDGQAELLSSDQSGCGCAGGVQVLRLEELSPTKFGYEVTTNLISEHFAFWTLRFYEGSPVDDDKLLAFNRTVALEGEYMSLVQHKLISNTSIFEVPGAMYGERFKVKSLVLPVGVVPVLFERDQALELGHGYCSCGYWGTCCYRPCRGCPRICKGCCKGQTFSRNCIGRSEWDRLVSSACSVFCGKIATFSAGCV
jgi:hypothetical protein